MQLSNYVNTLGQHMLRRYGRRVHKVTIDGGFTCPNRDGTKGRGGCTFCNNASFSPNTRGVADIHEQIDAGRAVVRRRTGARDLIAYFQAYTGTYDEVERLRRLYDQALAEPDVIGISVGTRPDCVPDEVLDLLARYRDRGYEVWLELGLQSASDETLARVNRGHGFGEFAAATRAARRRGLQVCAHLIVGLPGEGPRENHRSLARVLEQGVQGLKLHPLHVVRNTILANQWRRGGYQPMSLDDYVTTVTDLVAHTPPEVIFHRLTGTAPDGLLLAPAWCGGKWSVLNAITRHFAASGTRQGSALECALATA